MNTSKRLRELLSIDHTYVVPGCYDGLSARLIERAGFPIVYASGGAIARSKALPDIGLLSLKEVSDQLDAIVQAVSVPVIVDADNGYGNALNVRHAVTAFQRVGVAGLHLEDQSLPKRCGHLAGKSLIPQSEFVQKIRAARDAAGQDLYLIARTDAIAVEGLERAIERASAYYEAGADMLFVEAPTTVEEIEQIAKRVPSPKLLNMFSSGKTPIVPIPRLRELGYKLVLAPGDLQRAAIKAMQATLGVLETDGNTERIESRLVSFDEREQIVNTQQYLRDAKKFAE